MVIRDPGGRQRSSWRTYRLCLESIPADVTHVLIVQDDAWPCERFAAACCAAIAERPDRIICLFISGVGHIARRVALARNQKQRWMEFPMTSYVPLVATVLPVEIARQIPVFADARKISIGRADDAVVGTFARAHRLTACATVPSLVQHRDDVPSAMGLPHGNKHPHRIAAWFIDKP